MWRVAQEVLANDQRHSNAPSVSVVWLRDGEHALIDITDNGTGITTTNIPIPSKPPTLQFWGAGSTTPAPATSADGGGIIVK